MYFSPFGARKFDKARQAGEGASALVIGRLTGLNEKTVDMYKNIPRMLLLTHFC
jgi:hypothetical protein